MEKVENLEQYDYSCNDFMCNHEHRYAPLIGEYLIRFSELEHELNLTIAEYFGRSHFDGYTITSKLQMRNKIELFCDFYSVIESIKKNDKGRALLDDIKTNIKNANTFRNILVHSNLCSLDKDYTVRAKIKIDSSEFGVKFERIKLTTTIIRKKISELKKVIRQLDKYNEDALNF